jgi:hypothetical protein
VAAVNVAVSIERPSDTLTRRRIVVDTVVGRINSAEIELAGPATPRTALLRVGVPPSPVKAAMDEFVPTVSVNVEVAVVGAVQPVVVVAAVVIIPV